MTLSSQLIILRFLNIMGIGLAPGVLSDLESGIESFEFVEGGKNFSQNFLNEFSFRYYLSWYFSQTSSLC